MRRLGMVLAATAGVSLLVVQVVRQAGEPDGAGADPLAIEAFIAEHWADPLPPQGNPPPSYSALEASLAPADCGQCHADQYAQWQESLHAHAMGAGILWQFELMEQAQANRCLRCHAPLAEQKALLALEQGWPAAPTASPPSYVSADLHRRGLVCAACHVRAHRRFGPPPRTPAPDASALPHGGFTASAAFQDSRFCATCHQFPEDGPRLNGKLHEDTYRQWQASRFAQEGISCQSCHMPERRHEWRGIHDADMVRRALSVELRVRPHDGGAHIEATIANTGAGHHFPTYLVPKVIATLHRTEPDGGERELAREVIGWQANVDLDEEAYDTRIPAGGTLRLSADVAAPIAAGARAELRLQVLPREHYERMFRHMLERALPADAHTLLQAALQEARAARFEALRLSEPLPAPAP